MKKKSCVLMTQRTCSCFLTSLELMSSRDVVYYLLKSHVSRAEAMLARLHGLCLIAKRLITAKWKTFVSLFLG